jgi:PAS domain S-box-containing protein
VDSRTVQDVNPHFLELTGYGREDFVGRSISEAGSKLGLSQIATVIEDAGRCGFVRYDGPELSRQDGSIIHVDVIGNSYTVGSQPVIQLNTRDVSDRDKVLKSLRESEQRFRLFVESVGDFALFQTDPSGTIVSWNSGAERLLGWTEQEALGMHASMLFTPEDLAVGAPERELQTARICGRAADERWHLRKDGKLFFASGVLTRISDEQQRLVGFAKVMRDITPRKQQEEQLRRSVSEKDTLVREIHHRVKNNLQVIVSLLSMQSRYTNDAQVLTAFQEAESRLRAIAHIHERLYSSDDLSHIEFAGYVTGLANELVQLYSEDPQQIELSLEVADLVLHIERAIPLGLIANELIQNCIKHGLRGGSGRLDIRLSAIQDPSHRHSGGASEDEWGELMVGDTGPGLPPDLDPARARSMGLRLVTMLVRQLRGELEVRPGPGAVLAVRFPLKLANSVSEVSDESQSSDR